jgi:Zn-dependent alcohol dehydrogenase
MARYGALMRAAIFVRQHEDLSLESVQALTPGSRDVVVDVQASGVCHSDQAVIDRMPGGNPMILEMQALEMTRRGGTTVLIGVAGRGTGLALPTQRMVMEDRTVKGSYYGSARVTRDFPRFIELIETGRVDLGGMVTKHFSLEDVNLALTAMRDGEVVRGVLTMS